MRRFGGFACYGALTLLWLQGEVGLQAMAKGDKDKKLREAESREKKRLQNETGVPQKRIVLLPQFLESKRNVSFVHISDTHMEHDNIKNLPNADFLLHTGDFTDYGGDNEFRKFNSWAKKMKKKFKAVILVMGNHDWVKRKFWHRNQPKQDGGDAAIQEIKKMIPDAILLHNELISLHGVTVFGSGWIPWQYHVKPDEFKDPWTQETKFIGEKALRWHLIPKKFDILLTHTTPFHKWGGSPLLRKRIERSQPKVHLFGHKHEERHFAVLKRGKLQSDSKWWGRLFPKKYPVQISINNAVLLTKKLANNGWNLGRKIEATRKRNKEPFNFKLA